MARRKRRAVSLTLSTNPHIKMNSNEKLEAALRYAARGWLVLPLAPNAKTPLGSLVPHGLKDATTDPQKIRNWWTQQPNANVGIATGGGDCGPYVVDVDAPHGDHKHDGAASLSAAGISLPPTLSATTPNGGRHLYYGLMSPPPHELVHSCANVETASGKLEGVDIRAQGGYIVAPPSSIYGKPYKWENYETTRYLTDYPSALHIKKAVAVAPTVTSTPRRQETSADTISRARSYLATCAASVSGEGGHVALLHAAASLVVGFNLDDASALGLLQTDFNPRCCPPWSEKELRHKVGEARRKPQRPFGYLLDAKAALVSKIAEAKAAAQGAAQSKEEAKASGLTMQDRYNRRRRLCDFPDPPADERDNPNALFDNGWLRKGGAAVVIAPSGVGKSVSQTQMDDCFAVGRDWFGIRPLRPLKIAVYQAEDDATEVADFRNNVRLGLHANGWRPEQVAEAEAVPIYHDTTGLAGADFLAYLQYAQERDRADLIIINPLQSFTGCDISKNAELSNFLRVGLNPILNNPAAPCGCIIFHHTNKVPTSAKDRKAWLDTNSAAYAGAGGAELTNYVRAVLVIRPHEVVGYFDLIAAKRGKRLNWKDAQGNPTVVKTIAHSEGVMFWREVQAEELAAVEAGRQLVDDEKRRRTIALVEENGQPFPSESALVLAMHDAGIGRPTAARKIIRTCVTNGELVKRARGNATEICTPTQLLAPDRGQSKGREDVPPPSSLPS